MHSFILKLILIFFTTSISTFFICNILYNEHLRELHLIFFAVFFCLSIIKNRLAWYLSLAALVWFEQPSLLLGFPNHFLSDVILFSVSLGTLIKHSPSISLDSKLLSHPFFLPNIAVILICIGQIIGMLSLWNRIGFTPIDWSKIPAFIGRLSWIWSIKESPMHNLSLLVGYMVQSCYIMILFYHLKNKVIELNGVATSLISGSIPVFGYALLQKFLPQYFPHTFSPDIGGPFQSGNHLSFYAGCILILSISQLSKVGFNHNQVLGTAIITFFALPLAASSMLIGNGRTAIIALFISGVCVYPIYLVRSFWDKNTKALNVKSLGLLGVFILFSFASFQYWKHYSQWGFNEINHLLNQFTFAKLIAMGGREAMYQEAWQALSHNWAIGLGDGSFFSRSSTNYEIHNAFLKWGVGYGLIVACLFLAYLVNLGYECLKEVMCPHPSAEKYLYLMFILYLLLCLFPDSFLSYRPLLSLTSAFFVLIIVPAKENQRNRRTRSWLAIISIMTGVGISAASIEKPPLYFGIDPYRVEHDSATDTKFRWHPIAHVDKVGPKSCVAGRIASLANFEQTISYALTPDHVIGKYFNADEYLEVATSLEQKMKISGKWRDFCVCNPTEQAGYLTMAAVKSQILSLSTDGFGADDRHVAFRLTNSTHQKLQECKHL